MSRSPLFARIAVIGTGLIGGSLARALKQRGLAGRVVGVARTEATRRLCVERGIVDEATPDPAVAAEGADLVYIAAPLPDTEAILRAVEPVVTPGTLVTDAGSVKRPIVELGEAIIGAKALFVGGHPLAGSEQQGAAHASADLFVGRPYLLTPGPEATDEALDLARRLAEGVEADPILVMDPGAHDRLVARISHLPHLVAATLVRAAALGAGEPVGTGFLSTTRIAAGPARMWREIIERNSEHVLAALGRFEQALAQVRRALADDDWEALEALLEEAARARRRHS